MDLLAAAAQGFQTVDADPAFRQKAREILGQWLTGPEYEAVRADSARFVVAPGHVFPSAERVVEEHEGYQIVQKDEDVRHIVEQLDPRKVAHA